MAKEDYIHVDDAVKVAIENGWITPKQLADYIFWSCYKDLPKNRAKFFKELQELLEGYGFALRKLPRNPSKRRELY